MMKKVTVQQEILLITGTSFSARQCCEKDETQKKDNLTEQEKLEEACWNGLLPELLPELFPMTDAHTKLYLWQVVEGFYLLQLDLGELPAQKDPQFSIDPYYCLSAKCYN
jgi:hypothetical protein